MDPRVSLDVAAKIRSTAAAGKQTLIIQRLNNHYNELPGLTNVQGKLTRSWEDENLISAGEPCCIILH